MTTAACRLQRWLVLVFLLILLLIQGTNRPNARAQTQKNSKFQSVQSSAPAMSSLFQDMAHSAQWVMGTKLSLWLEVPSDIDERKLIRDVFYIVRHWESVLSSYDEKSELSELNRNAGKGPTLVSADLFRFLKEVTKLSALSENVFRLTVGPLIALYRKGRPTSAILHRSRLKCRSEDLYLLPKGRVLFAKEGMRLDAGGVGKGYALDKVWDYLRQRSVKRAFIDFGGSGFIAIGKPKNKKGWPVLISSTEASKPFGIVYLEDQSLSSSRTYLVDQTTTTKRAHIVDPQSGKLIYQNRYAVVVSESAAKSEVLSTSLILDPSLYSRIRKQKQKVSVFYQQGEMALQYDTNLRLEKF